MPEGQNDNWGSSPPPHRDSPERAGAEHARPWYRSPWLWIAVVLVVLVAVLALAGGEEDADVSDVPHDPEVSWALRVA